MNVYSNLMTGGMPQPGAMADAAHRFSISESESDSTEESVRQNRNGHKGAFNSNRKRRRGIIEKRRRDRINNSLNELRRLVPAAFEKQGAQKLEKAEILQLTVEHLRFLHTKGVDSLLCDPQRVVVDYHSMGFRECASEVARYLSAVEGLDLQDPLRMRLLSHLQCYSAQRVSAYNSFNQLPPHWPPTVGIGSRMPSTELPTGTLAPAICSNTPLATGAAFSSQYSAQHPNSSTSSSTGFNVPTCLAGNNQMPTLTTPYKVTPPMTFGNLSSNGTFSTFFGPMTPLTPTTLGTAAVPTSGVPLEQRTDLKVPVRSWEQGGTGSVFC